MNFFIKFLLNLENLNDFNEEFLRKSKNSEYFEKVLRTSEDLYNTVNFPCIDIYDENFISYLEYSIVESSEVQRDDSFDTHLVHRE